MSDLNLIGNSLIKAANEASKVVKEYISEGFEFLPVDVNKSDAIFKIDGKGIRMGLTNVMGLGEAFADKIVASRPFTSFVDFRDKVKGMEKLANVLLKVGAFRELKFNSIQRQQSLFGDHLMSKQEFDYTNPDINFVREYCPLAVHDKVRKEWMPWMKKNLFDIPGAIKKIESITEPTEVMIIGTTDPKKYFNPKNKLEEHKSRGLLMEIKPGEPNPEEEGFDQSFYDFLNFDLEDETDYVTVRIPYKKYKRYKSAIWSVKPDEVLLVKGMVNGGIRMVFANSIISLTRLKRKLENGERLTSEEKMFVLNYGED